VSSVFTRHLDEAPLTAQDAAAINRGNALALFPRLVTKSAVRA
jgi:hypothetical protein